MDFPRLKAEIAALATQAYRPGAGANYIREADCYIKFRDMKFIDPAPSTISYFIIHLSSIFTSSNNVRNCVSRARFLHKQLSLAAEAFNTFKVSSLLWATDLMMRLDCFTVFPSCPIYSPSFASSLPAWAPWDHP